MPYTAANPIAGRENAGDTSKLANPVLAPPPPIQSGNLQPQITFANTHPEGGFAKIFDRIFDNTSVGCNALRPLWLVGDYYWWDKWFLQLTMPVFLLFVGLDFGNPRVTDHGWATRDI